MIIALIVIATVTAFCFGVGCYTFFAACARKKEIDWLDEAAIKKTAYGQFYDHVKAGDQWLKDHGAQDIFMRSHDGLKLHAKWVPAENARGTIILVHGYHSCVLTDFGLAFELYHKQGLNLLLPSHRAHGKSEGKYTTFGVLESRDIQHWIYYHNDHFGHIPVICSGLSMGAATVKFLAGMELPENVKGFIADCGFTSPKEIIASVFTSVVHIPAWPFMWAANLSARFFAGFWLGEKHSTATLANNSRPILLIHGTADDFVPCEMTRRSFAACSGDKELLLVDGATHGVSFLRAREEYVALVDHLLAKCLENIKGE